MRRACGAGLLAIALGLAACGGEEDEQRPAEPARPLATAGCSPLSYGGKGRPDYLVAASAPLHGAFIDHGVQDSQALKLTFASREWRAGDYTVGLQICDEVTAKGDEPSPEKCRRNARAFVRNRAVLALIGPQLSGCAREMLAILNEAQGGPLAAAGPGPTYLGLTRSGPGVEPDEPQRHYPTGRRTFVRLAPADDAQGAAAALFAKDHGARSAFALNDGSAFGHGLAETFSTAAERLGVEVVGRAKWDAGDPNYRELADRVRRAEADTVYLGGYISSNGARLVKDVRTALGPKAQLIGPDGFYQVSTIVEGAGDKAEGFTATIAVLPVTKLPPAGRKFAAEFEKRYAAQPCCFSVHYAQAAEIVLDAIGDSDGSRGEVTQNLLETRVDDGLIGDFRFDRHGDTTLNTLAVYRIEDGKGRFHSAISPPAKLLARR